jgi:hypothetical protein
LCGRCTHGAMSPCNADAECKRFPFAMPPSIRAIRVIRG